MAYVDGSGNVAWWIVGGAVGALGGLGSYYFGHQDNFNWQEAALWTAGGAVVGATFGAGAEWVAGAMGAQAVAGAASSVGGGAIGTNSGQRIAQGLSQIQIAAPKLDYLLRADAGKSKGFEALGFNASNAGALHETLLSIGQKVDLANGITTQYGVKFERAVEVIGPNGTAGRIATVWQMDHGSDILRLITAMPMPFE